MGKDTHTFKDSEKELGKDFSIAQIGPAGENLCDLLLSFVTLYY